MLVIYKYPLILDDWQTLELPKGYQILDIQTQLEDIFLWALIDNEEQEMEKVTIMIIGTGRPGMQTIDKEKYKYLKTTQQPPFVWHVFQYLTDTNI